MIGISYLIEITEVTLAMSKLALITESTFAQVLKMTAKNGLVPIIESLTAFWRLSTAGLHLAHHSTHNYNLWCRLRHHHISRRKLVSRIL